MINITEEEWKRIYYVEYVEQRLSIPKLAEKYHLGSTTIHRNFKKYGLKCRSHSEKSRKYQCDYHYFDIVDCEEKAYFLGLIYSDGYITGNCFGISLKQDDVDIIEKLKKCLNSTHPIRTYTNKGYGGYENPTVYNRLIIRSEVLVKSLINQGVKYNKSGFLLPPTLPHDLIRHFIRGFMDGDGSIYTSCRSVTVSFTGTLDMLNYIGNYMVEEGIIKRFSLYPERNSDVVMSLKIGGNIQSRNLLHHIYDNSTVYMNRKHNIFLNLIEKSS